jgi:hypothetical protein
VTRFNPRLLALRAELAMRRSNPLLYVTGVLCFLAALVGLMLEPIWQERLQSLRADLKQAQDGSQRKMNRPAEPVVSQNQRNLTDFLAILGDAKYAEQQLQSLFVMARGLEIGLPQGQYKMDCEENSLLCSYRVQLPVKGTYTQVRSFVQECLQAVPALSLDELVFKRETVTDEELEVRLVMTLVVRAPTLSWAERPKGAP